MRIKYRKVGTIRFVSHRDVMRILRRAMAAGQVPVCYSQGFNPHPRLSFGPSLRTGWESLAEYVDAVLEEEVPSLAERCRPHLPQGLDIEETAVLEPSVPKLSTDVTAAAYRVVLSGDNIDDSDNNDCQRFFERAVAPQEDRQGFTEAHGRVLDASIRRTVGDPSPSRESEPTGAELLDLKVFEKDGELCIEYLSTMREGKSLFPENLLKALVKNPNDLTVPPRVVRRDLLAERDGDLVSPIASRVTSP